MNTKENLKKICLAITLTLILANIVYGVEPTVRPSNQKYGNHSVDLGIGFGLDYGGLIGVKLAYILPFPHISIFGSAGAQLLGFGWNVGTTFHILPQSDKFVFRPNLKIMYGINRSTKVIGASEYDKMFTGITPGIGLEFMFGRKKANGFDFDLNFPIGSTEFNDQIEKMENDPRISSVTMIPFAISLGYHHEF